MLVPDSAGPGGERVKLLDFGIAKLGAEHLQGDDVKSRTGQILGTAAYMSPEQFMGRQSIDCQTDVYSLGVVMFRMLAGRIPFISTNGEMALGMMHLNEPPPPVNEFAKETSEWLVKLVDQMLAKTAAQRPTMAQVMSELQAHLPFRASSRSLPIFQPNSGAFPSLKPAANPSGASQEQKPVAGTPLLLGADRPTSLAAGAGQSGEPGAGTITRATGQRFLARGVLGSRLGAGLAIGLVVLMLGGIGLYLRTPGRRPVPASDGAAATSSAPAASAPVANPPSPGKPGAVQGATGTPGGKTRTPGEAAATSADGSRRPGRDKGSRLPSTTKPAERKTDDKSRRAPKSSPTPIID